ncbi:helix-turn-helix DNA-binding domain protein [Gordonia phage Banquo]|uniref:Helix-turn-helix DNA-binding protein n=1 Tax=Gordonia phage TinaLin TaxID=2797324 RepID=A0A7T7K7Z1_9CAUD|nr:replication initiation protein [Gordonia phage TinaLin]QQM15139.1 helix-turn-helix DNA-binding protein [Gordonia phage TinaLin]URM87381.1 helix-turn-helix DNA-binding domain protein [Gordonia phage Banquo]
MSIPKRDRAAAVGFWTLAGSWSARELTDGYVPAFMLTELSGTKRLAAILVEAELWSEMDNGYIFRQWSKYNPTADQVRSDRDAARERMRRRRRSDDGKYAETGRVSVTRGTGGGPAADRRRTGDSSGQQRSSYNDADAGHDENASTSDDPELFARTESEQDANFERSSDEVRPPRPDPTQPIKKRSTTIADPEGFAEFWQAYPKKADKGHARKAYAKAIDVATVEEIIAGAKRYRDDPKREQRFTKNPGTWLNGECWEDETATAPPVSERRRYQEI